MHSKDFNAGLWDLGVKLSYSISNLTIKLINTDHARDLDFLAYSILLHVLYATLGSSQLIVGCMASVYRTPIFPLYIQEQGWCHLLL